MQLYKEEDNFVHYLVDLAVYLLECEYDWAESGGAPKGNTTDGNTTPAPGDSARSTAAGVIDGGGLGGAIGSGGMSGPGGISGSGVTGGGRKMTSRMTFESYAMSRRLCPYCGSIVGDLVICPACRNVTR